MQGAQRMTLKCFQFQSALRTVTTKTPPTLRSKAGSNLIPTWKPNTPYTVNALSFYSQELQCTISGMSIRKSQCCFNHLSVLDRIIAEEAWTSWGKDFSFELIELRNYMHRVAIYRCIASKQKRWEEAGGILINWCTWSYSINFEELHFKFYKTLKKTNYGL